ncbi:PREDICTED: zinc finger protein 800 isoform X2 [Dinoponera quadriceps]|uniref:Zinc finger protein 800 isoform X2 n=1 Tax=Dinoponera quadriceps TaxID=609295 RepID=A0A6P3WWK3_DINQU|nr:PREDICTED: zinc finger protein 800 isoform X2 [Dinoponera quadriceps]
MALEKIKSMQAEAKSKKKNGKLGKEKPPRRNTNNIINPDLSNLRKPTDTSVSTLYHISKLLENSTEEVKSILSYECDIIYECRICRSLFRSIVNLISHKREYCREKFDITIHGNMWGDFNTISAIGSVIHTYQTEQTMIKNNLTNDRILRSQVPKETRKKDLSAVIDTLIKKQEEKILNNFSSESKLESNIIGASNNQHIYLKAISTNDSAVYQEIKSSNTVAGVTDLLAKEVVDLQNNNSTILEGYVYENQLEKNDDPIQADISEDDKSSPDSLVCTKCNAKFSTKKMLTFHVKTMHTSQRVCYTCPCCTNTFASTWSVHLHLFKVHKMNTEQVRKLRRQIQEIKLDREATAMQGLKNEKRRANKVSALKKPKHNNVLGSALDITQEIFLPESDVKDWSCNQCGEKFNTEVVLSAHSMHCLASIATSCNEVTTKIIQSDGASSDLVLNNNTLRELRDTDAATDMNVKSTTAKDTSNANSECMSSSSSEIIGECHETTICIQDISTLSKEGWDTLECHSKDSLERNSAANNNVLATVASSANRQNTDDSEVLTIKPNDNSQSPEIIHQDTSETSSADLEIIREKDKFIIELQQDGSKLQPSRSTRRNGTKQALSIESKIAAITNVHKLQCLLCKRKFPSMTNLRRHLAIHLKWYRYRCKLCDFKYFLKCGCVAHYNKMHNAQNNRAFTAEVVVKIPQNKYRCNEDVVTDVTNMKKELSKPDIAERTASSFRPDLCEDSGASSDANTSVAVQSEEVTTTKERVAESHENDSIVQRENVPTGDTNETTVICTNLEEYMANRTRKLNIHPDLKRIVMEMILGSSDTDDTAKQADSEKRVPEEEKGPSDKAGRDMHANDNENSNASTDNSRVTCSLTDDSKPQRPMRKRIKPLSEDFIYDLKDIPERPVRKGPYKGSSFQLGKSAAKHHSCNSDSLTNTRKKAKLFKAVHSN